MSNNIAIVAWSVTAVPAFYAFLILFGAPWFTQVAETLQLAVLLTVLTAVPVAITTDARYPAAVQLIFDLIPATKAQFFALRLTAGTLLGTWLGAFTIPLDWDRWWQVWPLPCVFGAVIGAVVGLLLAGIEQTVWPWSSRSASTNREKAY
uniref:Phosphatidylinositol-glycan biosynthesis class F protein n=1 Tax=Panagrellus redivivus TaxID=6233 RepID=A0A7E4VWH6_PANRE